MFSMYLENTINIKKNFISLAEIVRPQLLREDFYRLDQQI